jgi:hypothetical protein
MRATQVDLDTLHQTREQSTTYQSFDNDQD